MSPWLWLFVWMLGVVASVVAHEAAHVYAGIYYGWTYKGMYFKKELLGVGVRLEANGKEHQIRKVAAAGPMGTLACIFALWPLAKMDGSAGMVFGSLFTMNVLILLVNLLPVGPLDGGYIFGKLITGRRLLYAWIVFEILAIFYLLFK